MRIKDISFLSPEENILFDDVLLSRAEQGLSGEILRFWESTLVFIVLGRIGKVDEDIFTDVVMNDQIPVFRRSSGGGTVVQGPGCLNYSFILSKENDPRLNHLRQSYQAILQKVIDVLNQMNIQAVFRPVSDLALASNNKKFSGNAQRRARKYILHHGTILYNFDLSLIEKYLKMPQDRPAYRQNRTHTEFVTNIAISPDDFKQAFWGFFDIKEIEKNLHDKETQALQGCLKSKTLQPIMK